MSTSSLRRAAALIGRWCLCVLRLNLGRMWLGSLTVFDLYVYPTCDSRPGNLLCQNWWLCTDYIDLASDNGMLNSPCEFSFLYSWSRPARDTRVLLRKRTQGNHE